MKSHKSIDLDVRRWGRRLRSTNWSRLVRSFPPPRTRLLVRPLLYTPDQIFTSIGAATHHAAPPPDRARSSKILVTTATRPRKSWKSDQISVTTATPGST